MLSGGDSLVIYADVLVSLNILITYIILVAVRVFCKIPTNKWAVMFASLIGGFSSLIIFWEDMNMLLSLAFKIFSAGAIVGVAFLPKSLKVYFKTYLSFFLVSFLLGGGVYGIQLTLKPKNILYYNGIVYFDMSISYLVGCVLSIYGVFLIADYLISRKSFKYSVCTLEITYNNLTVTIPAFIDTGNTLVDGLSARPVIVAELSAIAPVFNREEFQFFNSQSYENIPESLYKNFHFVPCSGVTGESILPSFLPEWVKITTQDTGFKTDFCTIGVVNKPLSKGEYKALLNNNIFNNVKEEKKYEASYI